MIKDTIVHKYLKNVSNHPKQIIYHYKEDDQSQFQTLEQSFQRAGSIATYLLTHLQKGDRALLLYPPGIDFLDAFWACQLAGIIAVPIPLTPDMEAVKEFLINTQLDCEASALLTLENLSTLIKQQQKLEIKASIPEKIMATDVIEITHPNLQNIELPKPEQLSFLQYTSGSVTKPKGVKLSHQNVATNLNIIDQYTSVSKMNNGCGWLPHFHDMGLIGQFLFPALIPGPFHFMSPLSFIQQPLSWLQMASEHESNIIVAPNFAFALCNKLVTEEAKHTLNLSCIQVALTGSEPINHQVLDQFAANFKSCGFSSKAFMSSYGMAETTLLVSARVKNTGIAVKAVDEEKLKDQKVVYDHSSSKKIVSCGVVDESYDLKVVHLDATTICTKNEIGEIWLNGASLSSGYWNQPSKAFNSYLKTGEGPYFRTGDLGFLDEQNELYITGRIKELVIIRGKNYYPTDIEQTVIKSHQAIRKGCVAAFSQLENDVEALTICVEIKNSFQHVDYGNLVNIIEQQILKKHGIKAQHIFVLKARQLPKTTSGKLQRTKTKLLIEDGELEVLYHHTTSDVNPLAEISNLENFLIYEVASLSKVPIHKIKVDECVFNFGLESIQLPELLEKIRQFTSSQVQVEQLITQPTIAGMVSAIYPVTSVSSIVSNTEINVSKEIPQKIFTLPKFDLID